MARTIDYWYQLLLTQKNNTPGLNGLVAGSTATPDPMAVNSNSQVADWNLWMYVVAVIMCALDNVFDLHGIAMALLFAAQKLHSPTWYQALALRFQYGQDTIPDTDQYANTGLTPDQITAQQIIAQAAVTEVSTATAIGLRVKVVKLVDGVYTQLLTAEMLAFTQFMNKQKDAGVNIIAQSLPGDSLRLGIQVFYDPLILKSDGTRIDGTDDTPVLDGINAYLQSLGYEGEYSSTRLSNYLQTVSGVILPNITLAQAQYGAFPYTNIDEIYVPDGGYFVLAPGYPLITYTAYV
ncbi:hypothetical protein [uncultured Mucilaginibacter sp.]|uniref:hypothetical protein n=1 Tax=uncultured Mucilaginibacter sp. TaxID=797541 RepID=UPI0025DC4E73|nr:hypothetical protein [uncultured Mucilaginibacter sp.]